MSLRLNHKCFYAADRTLYICNRPSQYDIAMGGRTLHNTAAARSVVVPQHLSATDGDLRQTDTFDSFTKDVPNEMHALYRRSVIINHCHLEVFQGSFKESASVKESTTAIH